MSSHADLSLPSVESQPLRPTQLVLLRHAEVEESYHRVFGGRIDMNLSAHGHEQAKALAAWLQRQPLDALYASPMKRVQQTLAPFLAAQTHTPVILPGLREIDFGDWTGLTWDAVLEKHKISAFQWLDQLERGAIPNAESGADYRARIEPCVREILRKHSGQNVAIACHGGVIRVILAILLKIPLTQMASFEIDYASATTIALLPHKTEVQFLNFTPWDEPGL
jgi:broad specificity phosphatase PhoE